MDSICKLSELRHNLEVAQALAKSHIGFVALPVNDREEFVRLSQLAAQRLFLIADKSEENEP